jgi:soluble lytic murein transglycosylase-like protein
MKKFPFICILALVCATPALAQNGYRFDNFDTPNGVRVASVQTTAELPPSPTLRPLSKEIRAGKTGETRPAALVYTRSLAMTASKSLDGFTTGDPKVDACIIESGARNGVDPVLLYAQMHQESSFKRSAVSPKGARGLMQLMPFTAARFGVKDIFDPRQNIEGGARYMRYLLDQFDGDVALALAGYNAGEGAVMKYGRRIPPYRETQEYVRRIAGRYRLMRDPQTAHEARPMTSTEAVAVAAEQPVPLTTYERHVFAVRMPDGRLQLVSQ